MFDIKVELDNSEEDIKKVIFELWEDVSEDSTAKEDFKVDNNHIWMKITVNDELAGYYHLHPFSKTILQVHTEILKPFRKYTDEITKVFKREVLKHIPDRVDQLICFIPEIYPNVLDYVLRNGWEWRGCMEKTCYKYGEYLTIDVLGITIEEFKNQVK